MEKVIYTSEDGISIVTLNRPENFNALDVDMLHQLLDILKEVECSSDQIVLIRGAGKAFCAGGDVRMMQQNELETDFDELMTIIEEITITLYLMPKIVISAVQGSAAGLGFSIALNTDYIVADEQTRFGMLFAGIGLIPDGGGHFLLKQRVGVHRSKQFIWGLQQLSGTEAKAFGLIDIMAENDVFATAKGLASKLLTSPLQAMITTKLIYHEQTVDGLRSYLAKEKAGQLKMRQTADHREGVNAFIEKRKPKFIGE